MASNRRQILASWLFLALALLLTFPVVITVSYLGDADMGPILAAMSAAAAGRVFGDQLYDLSHDA
jgi:hypothetical protein